MESGNKTMSKKSKNADKSATIQKLLIISATPQLVKAIVELVNKLLP